MNMHAIDWVIVAALATFLIVVVLATRKYMKGVADFLAAGRCGGRYLLCISEGIAGLGAITLVAFWEQYSKTGFTGIWWSLLNWPILFILALTGFVLYRYRQTRAMTMAQFFEMRYSRSFRIYAGVLGWISGVVNYGIFPGINARLLIYFCGLPESFRMFGAEISTFPVVMAVLLSFALFFTFMGGQIAIMLSNFVQGVFTMVVLLAATIALFSIIGWHHIAEALATAPENESLVNPFRIGETKGFNVWFFLIGYFFWVYYWKAWQGTSGYNASGKTPHETRMAQVLGMWRYFSQEMLIPIFAICALAVMLHPDFIDKAKSVHEALSGIANEKERSHLLVPVVLSRLLPIGIMGALTAVMLAAAVSTDETYMHSWGSMFIQDVVMPVYGRPLPPRVHLWLLRLSMCGVAVFAFFFSWWFSTTEHIRMFFAITGAIYLGGAGSCIIGGLYTRRGTTAAAFCAMTTGCVLAVSGIVIRQIVEADPVNGVGMVRMQALVYQSPLLQRVVPYLGTFDGQVMSFFASVTAITVYCAVSLLGWRSRFNLDRMLHRGQYRVQEDTTEAAADVSPFWRRLLVTSEFTLWDRIIHVGSILWAVIWGAVFLIGMTYHYTVSPISDESWLSFWHGMVWMSIILATCTTTWFLIGGLRDAKEMFRLLRTRVRDHTDDGSVRRFDEAVVAIERPQTESPAGDDPHER